MTDSVIDLGRLRGVRVDPDEATVRVEPGCTLADLDHATHAFGLAVPTGIFGTTGIAGLALGGGVGHLTRKFGLTLDNLLEADVLLASGNLVTASASKNEDLFWAICGGGGNFGVVTSFLFRAHPVSMIVGGPTLYELDQAEEVLRWYRDFIPAAPLELNGFFAFLTVPPAPPFPEHLHLKKMAGIVWCYSGDPDESRRRVCANPRIWTARPGRDPGDAVSRPPERVRSPLSGRTPLALACRFRHHDRGRRGLRTCALRSDAADVAVRDASLPDRWGGT